jgi:hypothetical protein
VYYFNKEAHSSGMPTLDIQYEAIQTDEPGVMKVLLFSPLFLLLMA